ncbi:hypothetical protein [Eubacterium sp.]|uniref:hypothetical protein n=1 Tax=Eubacterium sp. TaxID=142586 RepID=UPI0025BC4F5A|nr:hypothetical protein [Eubacterium sp.]
MLINQFLQWIINLLGGSHFNVNFDGSIPDMISSILNLIAYVLPLDVMIQIAVITFVLYVFRVVVAVIRSLGSILPF